MTVPTLAHREAVARAEDLSELLDHIAYRETLKPEIEKTRAFYQQALTRAVLGQPVSVVGFDGKPSAVSAEQLAGMCYGLDFLLALIERVLRKGSSALKVLRQAEQLSHKSNL